MTTLVLFDRDAGRYIHDPINVKITPALCVFLRNQGMIIMSATPKAG